MLNKKFVTRKKSASLRLAELGLSESSSRHNDTGDPSGPDPPPWLTWYRYDGFTLSLVHGLNPPLVALHLLEDIGHKDPLLAVRGEAISPLLHHSHQVVVLILQEHFQLHKVPVAYLTPAGGGEAVIIAGSRDR